jgi:hypothetical protein
MADLVIGGRRANPQRWVRAVGFVVAIVVVAFVVAWFIYRRAVSYDVPGGVAPADPLVIDRAAGGPPQLRYGAASLSWAGSIAVVRASGDPHAIGAAEGRLLAADVAAVARSFAAPMDGAIGGGALTHGMRVAWRYRFLDDGMPEDQRRAIAGVVRGAEKSGVEVAYQDLVRDQAALDVGVPAPWSGEERTHVLARGLTFVVPQADRAGRVWVGRSFALPGIGDGGDAAAAHPVVRFVKPAGRIAWAGVGWAGLAGAVTGVNAEGLVVTVNPVRAGDVRPTRSARPVAMLARSILEQCASLDDAVKLADATPTLGAAAITVVDGKSGHWAVLERTPAKLVVTRDPAQPAVGDLLASPAFADDLENDRAKRTLPTVARLARVARLVRGPLAEPASVVAVLRDRRGADEGPLPAGHRAAIDDAAAIHVVVIDPSAMQMWVADGGASARFRAFDLRYELRGEGDRPAPPAEIPAAEPSDPTDAAIRASRADLRAARTALADDEPARADEDVARALARTPAVPEALELAGATARARGDRDAAKKAYQAWFDGGPDDPGAEEEIRAQLGGL